MVVYTSFQLSGCPQGNNTFNVDLCSSACGYLVNVQYHPEANQYSLNLYDSTVDDQCFGAITSQSFFSCNGKPQTAMDGKTITCSKPTELLDYSNFELLLQGCVSENIAIGSCSQYCESKSVKIVKDEKTNIGYTLTISDESDCSNPKVTSTFNCLSGNITVIPVADTSVVCVDTSEPGGSSSSLDDKSSTNNSSIIKSSSSILILISIIILNLLF